MRKFSANLGFLFNDRPLAQAIHAAKAVGFDAVELHWPYEENRADLRAALEETGLPLLSLNTLRGDLDAGDNGLAALIDRRLEAQAAIEQAFEFGADLGARFVHVMAGKASGDAARDCFLENLNFACDLAKANSMGVLIEPLNRHDAPDYFLVTTEQAADLVAALGRPELRLMFDCYHVQKTEGDVCQRLSALLPLIGHIQFASVPNRGEPSSGELSYQAIFSHLDSLGWDEPLGAEYRATQWKGQAFDWMKDFRA